MRWTVAPHDGCVDWNGSSANRLKKYARVAPHDGCVDWNRSLQAILQNKHRRTPRWVRGLKLHINWHDTPLADVAPHDGCVDWNIEIFPLISDFNLSHPTMGAWIEIHSVDLDVSIHLSRTPRWVRGLKYGYIISHKDFKKVAPHDGCVDWNQPWGCHYLVP